MSQRKQIKKGDIFFYLFLVILVLAIVGVTIWLIYDKNRVDNLDDTNNPTNNQPDMPYFTFESVSEAPVMDVFSEYYYNPIDIKYVNHKVVIDGLKNQEVQNKVNSALSELELYQNRDGEEYCNVTFNVSNVLSVSCNGKSKNINLVTGEEIKLEDILQHDSNLRFILLDSIYKNMCAWGGCDPEYWYDQTEYNDADDFVTEIFRDIQKKDYELILYNNSFYLETDIDVEIGLGGFYFSDFLDDVTIYDRFLTNENIYEEEPSRFCHPQDCTDYESEFSYDMMDFIADNVYLSGSLYNFTNTDLLENDYEEKDFDDEAIEKLYDYINELYNLDVSDNYQYVQIFGYLYNTNLGYTNVIIKMEETELNYEDFRKRLFNEVDRIDPISNKEILDVSIIIDSSGNISKLEDDPNKLFVNFEEILASYITNDYNLNGSNSPFYSYIDVCYMEDDYNECMANLDFMNLVKSASYSIDLENRRIYMRYTEGDGIMAYAYISTFIPFELFELKTT